MAYLPDPALLALRLLRDEVAEMRDDLRYLLRAQLNRDARRTGLVLFPLAAELLGGRPFTGQSLLEAAMNDRTTTGEAAREILADMATDSGGLRAFGRLLSRLEGVPLASCRLVDAGETSEGRRWRLVRVSGAE